MDATRIWMRLVFVFFGIGLCGGVFAAKQPLYCVIDLSWGPASSCYPVSYLDDKPSEGWTTTNKTTKLVLRWVEPGTFLMGSPAGEVGRNDITETQHEVTFTKGFWIGVFEVTQRQWELVMGENPAMFCNPEHYATRPVEGVSFEDIRGIPKYGDQTISYPVGTLSFMGKLRARTEIEGFDLPTEAQWEYACRAGTTTALNNDLNLRNKNKDGLLDGIARYWHNGGRCFFKNCKTSAGTAEVGTFSPNAWGLYDMHGNVWEWCLDKWKPSLGTGPVTDPIGAGEGTLRIYRGGGWGINAQYCRSACRVGYEPSYRSSNLGFRVSCAPHVPPSQTRVVSRSNVLTWAFDGHGPKGQDSAPSRTEQTEEHR